MKKGGLEGLEGLEGDNLQIFRKLHLSSLNVATQVTNVTLGKCIPNMLCLMDVYLTVIFTNNNRNKKLVSTYLGNGCHCLLQKTQSFGIVSSNFDSCISTYLKKYIFLLLSHADTLF